MRNWKAFAFAAVASTLLAGSLQAQTGTGTFRWIGVASSASSWFATSSLGADREHVSTSPYRGKFAVDATSYSVPRWMLPPSETTVDIFCLDFFRAAITGSYSVTFTNLGDGTESEVSDNLERFTHDGGGTLQRYLAAAYLAQKIQALEPNLGLPAVKDMSGAIWQLMSGTNTFYRSPSGNPGSWVGGIGSPIQAYVDEALAGASYMKKNEWVVASMRVRDANGGFTVGESQDWLVHVTPEPTTLLLLGTGLLATLMAAGTLRRSAV